jgi:heat shock protein HtpX
MDAPSPHPQPSIARRATLAVVLMAGFYGLAVVMVVGLLWIPYAEWRYANKLHGQIAFFCIAGAFLIGKSIVPRPDRFEPPGPPLDAERHPRLFAEVRQVAQAVAQPMPAEVYLVPDVNAWVTQRGGIMGFGGRRVMGLGLPLLQALSVVQFRAVLAHEFGHYHGGDVKLGPWIYKTRQALGRTLQALAQHSEMLMKPFEWYGALFLRVTHAVSRHQELQADALAARVTSGPALAGALRRVHGATLAFVPYWNDEVDPVLSAGFLPPLAGGFGRFVEQPAIAEQIRQAVEEELREGRQDPYDTHPSLRERLAALGPDGAAHGPEDASALSLLGRVADVERELVESLAPAEAAQRLQAVAWEEVGSAVHAPRWTSFVREHAAALAGLTPASLPQADWAGIGRRVAASAKNHQAEPARLAQFTVGAALAAALIRRGFAVEAPPGGAVALTRGELRLEPFGLAQRLAGGDGEAERWRALCRDAQIADLDLGREAQAGPDPS